MPTEPHADRRRAPLPTLTGVAIMAALGAAFVVPRIATAALASAHASAVLVGVSTARDGTEYGRAAVASLTRAGAAQAAALGRERLGPGDGNAGDADAPQPSTSASAGYAPATQDATSSSPYSADPKPGHDASDKKDKKDHTTRPPAEGTGPATSGSTTGDPPSSGDSGTAPVPVLNPAPPSASPSVGSGQLAAGPSRVPDPGSQPRAEPAPAPAAEPPATVAAGWASFLPGREAGIRIFVAGLIALAVAIAGLVTVAVRRRP